ncbi:hypothetical protein B0T20DRAFT_425299 [Sordaria brevicollis]|uniref:DUF7136 domain-containing protein n=1 Tax=Sordaria brevicollis TaxID=83679 RepID=A0AAE0U2Z6_SORBR|nr:hypothetical protein B0T20DRAFT_425299 [Sordaria brevicollis]
MRHSSLAPLLLLASTASAAPEPSTDTITYPQTVQVDLVFPRNGTYTAPKGEPFFPFIFALHNAKFDTALVPTIDARLAKLETQANGTETPTGKGHTFGYAFGFPEGARNFSSDAGPAYAGHPVEWDDMPEGRYLFTWSFKAFNCSEDDKENWAVSEKYAPFERSFVLTIDNGDEGKNPADAATLAEDSCKEANQTVVIRALKAIEMESEAPWSRQTMMDKKRTCAVLDTMENTPEPEACGSLSEEKAKEVLADTKDLYERFEDFKNGGDGNLDDDSGASGLKALLPTLGGLSLVAMIANYLV